jgi:hypothetical protein
MRRALWVLVLAGVGLANTGCFIPGMYPSDPTQRMKILINQSEDLRTIQAEMARFWMTNHPSHLTPDRVDGWFD